MGSEIQSDRSNQAQDLRDLQESYRKRRKAVVEEGEEQLDRAQQNNQEAIKKENLASTAAINHVRDRSREALEALKAETDNRVTYERRALNKRVDTTKQSGEEQVEVLDKHLKAREDNLRQALANEEAREGKLQKQEAQAEGHYAQELAERRADVMRVESDAIAEARHKAELERQSIDRSTQKQIQNITEEHHKELAHLQEEDKSIEQHEVARSQHELKTHEQQFAKTLDNERDNFQKNQAVLQERARKTLANEQAQSDTTLDATRKKNESEISQKREAGVRDMEKTRKYYDQNIATIHKRGDQTVATEREDQEYRVTTQKERDKEELDHLKFEHQEGLKEDNDRYKKEETADQAYYRKSLAQQRQNYELEYKKNLKQFDKTMNDRREQLKETLAQDKIRVMGDVGRYADKSGDPFYHMANPKAQLRESGTHYIVEARIPEHEKDNVRFIVHDDKVVIMGQRQYNDRVQDESGKLATSSVQSYRQEIALPHPVHERLAETSYENGTLRLRVPKA